uniref:Nanos-type domain-containing protein n=1 Tax=Globodera pallida TaxID=36090 RepID=A0A183CDY0_GLOPA
MLLKSSQIFSELGHEVQHQHEDVIGGDEDGEGQNDHYENRGGQFLGEMGPTMMGQKGEENAGGGNGRQSHQQEAKMEQLSVKETNNLANQASGRSLAHPMTSFLELAGCAAAFGGEGQMKGDGKAMRPSGEERGRTDEQNPEKGGGGMCFFCEKKERSMTLFMFKFCSSSGTILLSSKIDAITAYSLPLPSAVAPFF